MINFERIIFTSFLIIAVFLAIDITDDLAHGADLTHVIFEAAAFIICALMLIFYTINLLKNLSESHHKELSDIKAQRDRWR